jgi:hypothetical protein
MSLKGRSCWVVNIRMMAAEKLSLEAIGRFVEASEEIQFEAENRQQLYAWVERVLVGQEYAQLGKAARGLVRRGGCKPLALALAAGGEAITQNGVTQSCVMDIFAEFQEKAPHQTETCKVAFILRCGCCQSPEVWQWERHGRS